MATQYEPTADNFLGIVTVGKTPYQVHRLPVEANSAAAGVVARFAMIGPRGSQVFVTDWGKGFRLNAVCMGGGVSWRAQPRPLRGLTREHLAAFYPVEA
jgi:hypothetical protein